MPVPVLWLLGHRVVQEHEALQPGAEEQEADRVVVVDEVAAKLNGSFLKFRVVQLNFIPEIKVVFYKLFERSLPSYV